MAMRCFALLWLVLFPRGLTGSCSLLGHCTDLLRKLPSGPCGKHSGPGVFWHGGCSVSRSGASKGHQGLEVTKVILDADAKL